MDCNSIDLFLSTSDKENPNYPHAKTQIKLAFLQQMDKETFTCAFNQTNLLHRKIKEKENPISRRKGTAKISPNSFPR